MTTDIFATPMTGVNDELTAHLDTDLTAGSAGHTNGCTTMNLMPEELARAQMSARLGEAHARRRGVRLASALRMSRKAERAASAARLALARAL